MRAVWISAYQSGSPGGAARGWALLADIDDGGEAIDVIVDFLIPRDAKIEKNSPPLISHVRKFVEDTRILNDRTPEQWQQDAFGQVDAWLQALGLRG